MHGDAAEDCHEDAPQAASVFFLKPLSQPSARAARGSIGAEQDVRMQSRYAKRRVYIKINPSGERPEYSLIPVRE